MSQKYDMPNSREQTGKTVLKRTVKRKRDRESDREIERNKERHREMERDILGKNDAKYPRHGLKLVHRKSYS